MISSFNIRDDCAFKPNILKSNDVMIMVESDKASWVGLSVDDDDLTDKSDDDSGDGCMGGSGSDFALMISILEALTTSIPTDQHD